MFWCNVLGYLKKKKFQKVEESKFFILFSRIISTQVKISSFKNPHIKIDLLLGGQNPLSYYIL
jgi:hypothetical protein